MTDRVIECERTWRDGFPGTGSGARLARRVAVRRRRQGAVSGGDAARPRPSSTGWTAMTWPSSRMRTSLAVLCTSTSVRRVALGTL